MNLTFMTVCSKTNITIIRRFECRMFSAEDRRRARCVRWRVQMRRIQRQLREKRAEQRLKIVAVARQGTLEHICLNGCRTNCKTKKSWTWRDERLFSSYRQREDRAMSVDESEAEDVRWSSRIIIVVDDLWIRTFSDVSTRISRTAMFRIRDSTCTEDCSRSSRMMTADHSMANDSMWAMCSSSIPTRKRPNVDVEETVATDWWSCWTNCWLREETRRCSARWTTDCRDRWTDFHWENDGNSA